MSIILSIETATKMCSVALTKNGELLAFKEQGGAYSHSELLHVFIDEVLNQAKVNKNEIVAVAVSKGPGSYTGLRIGVSAAKGLCYALNIPLISVSTLKAMALKAANEHKNKDALYCPMIDARRMEVYTALFNCNNEIKADISAKIIDENTFNHVQQPMLLFGDGAAKCAEVLKNNNKVNFINNIEPSAIYVAAIAEKKYSNKAFEDMAYFEPYYLKDFVATTPKKRL